MPDGFVQLPADGTGKRLKTIVDAAGDHIQYVREANPVLFTGRAATFRTPGRAGTANHPIFGFFNGSLTRVCRIKTIAVDLLTTAPKAATVVPAIIRFYRITAAPLNGVTLTKVAQDTAQSSDANVVLRGDASADGTSATLALAATVSGGALTQEYAPRIVSSATAPTSYASYEMFDRDIFFDTSEVVCRPSEGLVLRLDYTVATANPTTDHWLVGCIWTEE